ncbi:MAG: hypothetical protein IPL61_00610 [Myxococcales bacterium]|nr:hypothetical protein [Myxococcales bacterium]
MCRRVNCSQCNKPTFAGCGMHVEQVLGDVPRAKRCRCGEEPRATAPVAKAKATKGHGHGKSAAPAAPAELAAARPWWQLFK